MNFRASFCDPFRPDIVEIGKIERKKIFDTFHKIPWLDYLEKMKTAKQKEIFYSPSLEIENCNNKNGISVSVIDETEWYLFFKRLKLVKRLFGLTAKMDNNYLTHNKDRPKKML